MSILLMITIPFAILDFGDLVEGLKDCPGIPKMQNDYTYKLSSLSLWSFP